MKKRVALIVYVDLDPVPGTFHTEDSAETSVQNILRRQIPHYNPVVLLADGDIQPDNVEEDVQV